MTESEARRNLELWNAQRADSVKRRDGAAYQEANRKVLAAERVFCKLLGVEYASPLATPSWRLSHPQPLIFNDSHIVWLICPIASNERPLLCRTIKFTHVLAQRYSTINDSLETQPLFGHGLESLTAHEVKNSKWIEQLKPTFNDEKYWLDVAHFAFSFKDCLVEVLAKSIEWLPATQSIEACINEAVKLSVKVASINGMFVEEQGMTPPA